MDGKEKSFNLWRALVSVIISLILTFSIILFVFVLFIRGVSENTIIPSIGPVSSAWLSEFFDSWYSLVIFGALILIIVLIVALINKHRKSSTFRLIGYSSVMSAILIVTASIIKRRIFELFSGDWQDALINTTDVFGEFCIICATVLIMIGAANLSIYSCIVALKEDRHEKNN